MAIDERVKLSLLPRHHRLLGRSVISPKIGMPFIGRFGDRKFVCPVSSCEETLCIGGGPMHMSVHVFKCPRCSGISTFRPFAGRY